jgi:hypothetical protein
MRAIAGWGHMMTQTVTVAPLVSRDGYGKPTYGTAVSYRCRLVGSRKQVVDGAGRQVTSMWTAYLMSNAVIDPLSLVTLTTGDVGSTDPVLTMPVVKAVSRYAGTNGWHHTVLHL